MYSKFNRNQETLIDNTALSISTLLGVSGVVAGMIIPEAAALKVAIQIGAYFPQLFAALIKQSIVSEKMSDTINHQIMDCSSHTMKQYLKALGRSNKTMFSLLKSSWERASVFDSILTLDNISILIDDAIKKEAISEGYYVTTKDINDALKEYTQLFFMNMRIYPELNQLVSYEQSQAINELGKKYDVVIRRLENVENASSASSHKKSMQTYTLKNNIIHIYSEIAEKERNESAKQQLIYYITRLGIDVSEFIVKVIEENPRNLYMRLSLAYGCVLSDNKKMREYSEF